MSVPEVSQFFRRTWRSSYSTFLSWLRFRVQGPGKRSNVWLNQVSRYFLSIGQTFQLITHVAKNGNWKVCVWLWHTHDKEAMGKSYLSHRWKGTFLQNTGRWGIFLPPLSSRSTGHMATGHSTCQGFSILFCQMKLEWHLLRLLHLLYLLHLPFMETVKITKMCLWAYFTANKAHVNNACYYYLW